MTSTAFFKMTGSGNDFVVLDGRTHRLDEWPTARIRSACDRRQGVGGDGLLHLEPAPDGAVRIRYFNADGSHAAMCGNAALCAIRLAARLELAPPDRVRLLTDAGDLDGRCVGSAWAAELRFPRVDVPLSIELPLHLGEQRAFQGTVGVPHTILVVDEVARADVVGRGRALRYDPRFEPAGSNINFVGRLTDEPDADWALRTYERGVEAETLACGTGTIAAALALAADGRLTLPVRIRSQSGGVYTIAGVLDGESATDVWLRGEGRLVFEGRLTIDH